MKFVLLFTLASILMVQIGSVDFKGIWKENDKLRTGLKDFLIKMGVSSLLRGIAVNTDWQNSVIFRQEDEKVRIREWRGPLKTHFLTWLVADNTTITKSDLDVLGGVRQSISEFKGNSFIVYLFNSNGVIDMVATRTILPENPDQHLFSIKHLPSGVEYTSYFDKQHGITIQSYVNQIYGKHL